jgi:hypothetical protein
MTSRGLVNSCQNLGEATVTLEMRTASFTEK